MGPKWPIYNKQELFWISNYYNFHALLAPFIVQNFKNTLRANLQLCLDILSMLLLTTDHTSYSSHFLRMLKDVVVQTLPQRRKITYHPLLVMYWLFSLTYFNARCWAYVPFKCSLTVAITLGLCASELSPTSDKDPELRTGTFHLSLIWKTEKY